MSRKADEATGPHPAPAQSGAGLGMEPRFHTGRDESVNQALALGSLLADDEHDVFPMCD